MTSWIEPKTWRNGDKLTAIDLDEQLYNNIKYLARKPIITRNWDDGDFIFYNATGAFSITLQGIVRNTVANTDNVHIDMILGGLTIAGRQALYRNDEQSDRSLGMAVGNPRPVNTESYWYHKAYVFDMPQGYYLTQRTVINGTNWDLTGLQITVRVL